MQVFIFLSGLSLFGIATAAMCTFIGQLAANVGVANLICILVCAPENVHAVQNDTVSQVTVVLVGCYIQYRGYS